MLRPINNDENLIKYKSLEWKNKIITDVLLAYPLTEVIFLTGSYYHGYWYDESMDEPEECRINILKHFPDKLNAYSDIDIKILPFELDREKYKNYDISKFYGHSNCYLLWKKE